MSELRCAPEKLMPSQEPSLTVGERFLLRCRGQVGVFDWKTAELRVDAADKYKIQLLKGEQTVGSGISGPNGEPAESTLNLEVVSDVVGKHQLRAVQLVDANQAALIPDITFEVKSVQNPQNPVQEPYGPVGPMVFAVPWFYWAGLAAAIVLAGLVIALAVAVRLRRRRLMREIRESASAQTPEGELYHSVRKFQRDWDFLVHPKKEIEPALAAAAIDAVSAAYRLFLSRVFDIPFARWGTSKSLRALRREQSQLPVELRHRINKTLREFDRARASQLHGSDFAQFLDWVKTDSAEITRWQGGAE